MPFLGQYAKVGAGQSLTVVPELVAEPEELPIAEFSLRFGQQPAALLQHPVVPSLFMRRVSWRGPLRPSCLRAGQIGHCIPAARTLPTFAAGT
jgi:hypothetical protein